MLKQKRSEEANWRIDHSLNLWSIELYTSSQFTPLEDFSAANFTNFSNPLVFRDSEPTQFFGALRAKRPIPDIFCVFAVV